MTQEYAVVSGHNNPGDLETIEDIRVSGRPLLSSIEALGEFDDGLERAYLDGSIEDNGLASWGWKSASMLPSEYGYIRTNILAGKRSGPVTVRTRLNDGTYSNFNATLTLPKRGDLQLQPGGWYKDVPWTFTSGEELA
jgi:hypothetical protein